MIILKIGIISDTHVIKDLARLQSFLDKYLRETDMIIHAGDFKDEKVVDILREYKNFTGVWGNADDTGIKKVLREKEIIEIENYKIGIFHGHGDKGDTFNRAYDVFKDDPVDVIIFGHSHQPVIKTKNKVLMLNPGSPTNKRKERWFSYIVLELTNDTVSACIKFFQ